MIRIQISAKPYKNNQRERDESRTVLHWREKGQQEYPEDRVKSPKGHPGQKAIEPLFA